MAEDAARSEAPASAGGRGRGGMLDRYPALRSPSFRALLVALMLGELGVFATHTAVIWVGLEETGSDALVGLLMALLSGAFLVFTLPVGLLSDRAGPQRSMLIGTLGGGVLIAISAALTLSGELIVPVAFALAIISGIVAAMIWVPGQLLAVRIVGQSDATGALGLRFLPIGIAWLLAGPLAGATLQVAGAIATYVAVAIVLLIAAAIVHTLPRVSGLESTKLPAPDQLLEAFRFIAGSKVVLGLTALAGIVGMFVMSRMAIYPALVVEVLDVGPWALGAFMAVHGVGAIVGAMAADPIGRRFGRGRTSILSLATCGAGLAGVGLLSSLALSLLFAAIATAGLITHLATGSAIVQLASPPRMRGRVVATYDFARLLLLTVGNLVAGILTGAVGPSLVFFAFGILTVAGALLVRVADPKVWRLATDDDDGLVEVAESPRA